MKKIIASALGLMMVGGVAASASAVEHQFGGYWRTRAFYQNEFAQDGESFSRVDNRTRLYYTAKFNDDFKFVNKFEFNTNWGSEAGGGIGADGTGIWRIKNSYADFTLGATNTKIGILAGVLARGFIFDDDFSGLIVTPSFGAGSVPVGIISQRTDDGGGAAVDNDEWTAFIAPSFAAGENATVTPYFVYWSADESQQDVLSDFKAYYLGIDADMKLDAASIWGTFIYNGGEVDSLDQDINGYLLAVGADAGIAHGEIFAASGDSDRMDGDIDAFVSHPGQSYYWSEIMGLGIFDNSSPAGAPGNKISNVVAANVGVTYKPADKIKLVGDLWYASLLEDNAAGEKDLGFEIDGKLTYALMDNLNADIVLAYLFVGDAIGEDDIFEGGVRLSLSF